LIYSNSPKYQKKELPDPYSRSWASSLLISSPREASEELALHQWGISNIRNFDEETQYQRYAQRLCDSNKTLEER
jgi:hypothetical protein